MRAKMANECVKYRGRPHDELPAAYMSVGPASDSFFNSAEAMVYLPEAAAGGAHRRSTQHQRSLTDMMHP